MPTWPLPSMGNHESVVSVRPARTSNNEGKK